ncbi:MAG: hypothetical protein AAGE83_13045, partial [Pseudomonadota bacterium]
APSRRQAARPSRLLLRLALQILLPFTRWAVPTIDLTAGLLVADPPAEAADLEGEAEEKP